jgi:outer membrane protein
MRKLIVLLLVVGASLSTTTAFAQKFAYVDTEYILAQMPEYRSAQEKLNEISKEWQTYIDKEYEAIEKMYKEYQAEKILLSKEMQQKREAEIIEREKAVKKYQKEKFGFEGELFKKRQEMIKPIQDRVFEAIQKISRDENIDFIFDKAGGVTMLVSNAKYDKSDEVLDELGVAPSKGVNPGQRNNLPPSGDDNLPDEE